MGDGGVIIKYNGTWAIDPSPTTNNLNGLHLTSSTSGWAVGDGGKILKYSGINWSHFQSPIITNLKDIYLNAQNDGWSVGDGGLYLRLDQTGGGTGGYQSPGTFISQVLNSDSPSTIWRNVYWSETLPSGTEITVAARSGNTAMPDGSWSAFTTDSTTSGGTSIKTLTGQYLQYRVTFTSSDDGVTPNLNDITVTYK
jgi:hypothetical protein